jgi:Kef-type K+ transport system membrane component KefB
MISLAQVAILLTAAVVAVSLFRRMKLSSVLGFLAAGLVIGPWGLRLITDVSSILHASEFGVVLLLFIIGLELQPTRLWVMRRTVFGLGSVQVLSCSLILGGAVWWLGLPPMAAAVVGFGLSLSSTPIVLQILAERDQLKTQYGRAAFGILLFQDLAVLPMLAVLPLMSPLPQTTPSDPPWVALVKLVAVIAIVTVGGRLVLRPALRIVARD